MRSQILFFALLTQLACVEKQKLADIWIDSATVATKDTIKATSRTTTSLEDNCTYSNPASSLGIGVVSVPEEFTLYKDSLLKEKAGSWRLHEEKPTLGFCAKFHKPDYGILHLVCIKKTARAFQVLINYDDIRYVPNTEDYDFETWGNYILGSFGVRREPDDQRSLKSLPLRTIPSDNADTVALPNGFEMFCPMEVSGDWIKVRYDCFYHVENNEFEGEPCHDYIDKCTDSLTGWIRWRENNVLLIAVFLMP